MSFQVSSQRTLALSVCFLSIAISAHAQGSEPARPITKGIILTLTSKQDHYSAEEPVIVDLHVTNKSDQTVSFEDYKSPLESQVFTLTDKTGRAIPLTAYGKQLLPKPRHGLPPISSPPSHGVELKPGQEAVYHVWLNRVFDLSVEGDYSISATKPVPDATGRLHPASANRLTITITSPDVPPYSNRLGPDEQPPSDDSQAVFQLSF